MGNSSAQTSESQMGKVQGQKEAFDKGRSASPMKGIKEQRHTGRKPAGTQFLRNHANKQH
tara:strand:+ start:25359 stop:25538 length:180 start_codon:yes stop_codon:yes gene_type:complete